MLVRNVSISSRLKGAGTPKKTRRRAAIVLNEAAPRPGDAGPQESFGVVRRPITSEATIPRSSLATAITSRSA